jgi:phage gpG-like protein
MSSKAAGWLLVWGVLCLSACHKSRTNRSNTGEVLVKTDSLAVTADSVRTDSTAIAGSSEPFDETKAGFKLEEIDFDYLTAKSKFSFKNRKQDIDNANVNIRIKKDSLIWFSVTGVGFEVARGIITPDTVVFMDKFHKEYYAFDFDQLSRQFKFKLNFALLQSLIVGNLPVPREPGQKLRREKDFLLLRQNEGRVAIDNYIGEKSRKLKRLQAVEQPTRNSLTLDYEDFMELSNYLFPFTSLITLDVRSEEDKQFYQTVIRIKHSKVDLLDTSPGFPFSIPSSYKKK